MHTQERLALIAALSKEHGQRSTFDLFTIQAWLSMVKFPPNLGATKGSSSKGIKNLQRPKDDGNLDLDYSLMIACMKALPKTATNEVLTVQGDPDANLCILVSGACGVYHVDCEGIAFEPEPEYSPTFSPQRSETERAFILRRMRKQRATEPGVAPMTSRTVLKKTTSLFRPAPLPWKSVCRQMKPSASDQRKLRSLTSYRAQRLGRISGGVNHATPCYRVPGVALRRLGSKVMLGSLLNCYTSMPPRVLTVLDQQQQRELNALLLNDEGSSQRVDRAATLVAARVRGMSQRNVLATKQEAAVRIEALVRGQRERSRLEEHRKGATTLAAFARGAGVRKLIKVKDSAATHIQASARALLGRAIVARRRKAAAASPALALPNLQVRRTGTLMELTCFNTASLLAPSRSDAIIVCDFPSELVTLDTRRYRELRVEGIKSIVDRKANFIRGLPVFQEAAANAMDTAVTTARRLATSQAQSRGLSKQAQLVAGNTAAEEAAVAAAARAVDDLRGLASNLKESSLEAGEHISQPNKSDLLLVTTGHAVLTAKDAQHQHALTLLSLGPGGLCSISDLVAIPSIADPVLRGAPCTCLWLDRSFVTQVLGQHTWNMLLQQAAATTQRVEVAAAGFAEATAPAPNERGIPPDPDTWWRNGPPACVAPLFVVSDEQLISKRPEPIELTEKEVEATRERLDRLRVLKQPRPKEEPTSWVNLISSGPVNRTCVWRCKWCDCDAELGKGMDPEGNLTLCFECSRAFMAGRKDEPGSKPSQHNQVYACSRCSKRFVAVETLQEHMVQCRVGLARGQPGWRCCWCRCGENEANGIERGPKGKTLCSLCAVKWRAGQRNPAPVELEAASRINVVTPASSTAVRQANTTSSTAEIHTVPDLQQESGQPDGDAGGMRVRIPTSKSAPKLTEVKMSHHSLAEVELSASGRLPPREKNTKFDYLFVKPTPRLSIYAEAQLEARALARPSTGEDRPRWSATSSPPRDGTLPKLQSHSPSLKQSRHLTTSAPSPQTPLPASSKCELSAHQLRHRQLGQPRPYSMGALGHLETGSPMMLNSRGTIDLRRPRSAAALPFRAALVRVAK